MTCPRTHAIVRLAAAELPPGEERDLREHLKTCQACAAAHSEMNRTWEVLGDWRLDLSGIDLAEPVLAKADTESRPLERSVHPPVHWSGPLRAAASIVVAIGLGVGAGHLVPAGKSAPILESPPPLEGITAALELIGLTSESATGLAVSLEPHEVPGGDEAS